MKTWQTTGGIKIYSLLDSFTNIYLVKYGSNNFLVDTARKYRYKTAKKRLEEILGKEQLHYLFLTHTHYDHAENAYRYKEDFQCRIIADEREKDFLENGMSPLPNGTNAAAKFVVFLGRNITKIASYDPANVDITIDDIYEIKTSSDAVRILRTPGHSSGSVSLILDNEIAIVGDTLFGISKKSRSPPCANDTSVLLNSWDKLLKTECGLFLPGHGGEISRKRFEGEREKRGRSEEEKK